MFRFDSKRQKAQELELSELRAMSAAILRSQAVIEFELDGTIITAKIPLASMFGYATDIRSLSSGRASYSMEPATFEPVPHSIAEEILDKAHGGKR